MLGAVPMLAHFMAVSLAPAYRPATCLAEALGALAARLVTARLVTALVLAACLASSPARAQQSRPPTVPTTPNLDRLLEARETIELADALAALPAAPRIAWLRKAILSRGSAVLVLPLSKTLLIEARKARRKGDETASTQMSLEAARYALFGYIAMKTTAPNCSDPTSPGEYLRELGEILGWMEAFLAEAEPTERAATARAALAMDDALRPSRRLDPMLCRRGSFGDRYCPAGAPPPGCNAQWSAWPEFIEDDRTQKARFAAHARARADVLVFAGTDLAASEVPPR